MIRNTIILILAFFFFSCTGTLRMHKDFETIRPNINTFTILPPDVQFFEKTATINELRPELKDSLAFTIQSALEELLAENEYEVHDAALSDSILLEDQELALDLTNTLKRYSDACTEIVKSKKKNLESKMNPEIGQFADMADANYIILIKGMGFGSSGGAIARDAVINVASLMLLGGVSISQYDGLILEIAIVDANSSEIIYFNRNLESDSKYLPLSKGSCKKLLYQLLDEKITTKYVSNRKRSRW